MAQVTSWNPESYAKNARFVSDLGTPLLQWLLPKPGERILDLGCGDGELTAKIAAAGAEVLGVDMSREQALAVRRRGLAAAVMDGHRLGLRTPFDAIFSNAALHWMKKPEIVVEEVAGLLEPGGRFVGELGGKGNVGQVRRALHAALLRRGVEPRSVDPWYFPSAEDFSQLLAKAGFAVNAIELFPRPTQLPGDITAWLEVFAQPFTGAIKEPDRSGFPAELREALESRLRDDQGNWTVDYVRLRFHASKKLGKAA